MAVFFQSISGVLVILVMIAVGYFLEQKGWFDDKSTKLIAKIVTQVSLPCYMLGTIVSKFSAKELLRMIPDLRFPVISLLTIQR